MNDKPTKQHIKVEYDLIERINTRMEGLRFEKMVGFPCVGDYLSNAIEHPIQYFAYTNHREGDDDPFEGIGWTPKDALLDLLVQLTSYTGEEFSDGM